jgi:hypothetical protein
LFRAQHLVIQGPVQEQWISGRPVPSVPRIVRCKCNYASMSERGNVLCNYRHVVNVYCPRPCEMRCNILCFYREDLLKLRPTLKLEDHHLSAIRDCLFNIFADTLHIGGRSSTRNLRTLRAVATGTHLSLLVTYIYRHEGLRLEVVDEGV